MSSYHHDRCPKAAVVVIGGRRWAMIMDGEFPGDVVAMYKDGAQSDVCIHETDASGARTSESACIGLVGVSSQQVKACDKLAAHQMSCAVPLFKSPPHSLAWYLISHHTIRTDILAHNLFSLASQDLISRRLLYVGVEGMSVGRPNLSPVSGLTLLISSERGPRCLPCSEQWGENKMVVTVAAESRPGSRWKDRFESGPVGHRWN